MCCILLKTQPVFNCRLTNNPNLFYPIQSTKKCKKYLFQIICPSSLISKAFKAFYLESSLLFDPCALNKFYMLDSKEQKEI